MLESNKYFVKQKVPIIGTFFIFKMHLLSFVQIGCVHFVHENKYWWTKCM